MISRLFNSPLGIGVLILIAGFFIFSNVVEPMIDSDLESNNDIPFEDPFSEPLEQTNKSVTDELTLTHVEIKNLLWIEIPVRDPFSSYSINKAELDLIKETAKKREQLVKLQLKQKIKRQKIKHRKKIKTVKKLIKKIKPLPIPIFTGLVSGSKTRYAVLNGNIVEQGQTVSGYLIRTIEKDGIELIRPNGHSLRLLVNNNQE